VGDGEKLFGSSHPGVFITALVDGSVRPIAFSIDRDVFEGLGDRSGGETFGSDSF
jgi:hypothetical protein